MLERSRQGVDRKPDQLKQSLDHPSLQQTMLRHGFYLLEILLLGFKNLKARTIVWYANGNYPSPRGSTLELTADRGLVLTHPQGQRTIVSDPIIGSIAYGSINDNGNFVIQNSNSESLWESYQHPTDTILPSQRIDSGGSLSSRRRDSNFSQGRFQLYLDTNGNLQLSTVNLPSKFRTFPYYSNGTNDSSSPSSRYQLVFNESTSIYISKASNQNFVLSQGDQGSQMNFYHRATLNFDGVFVHYRRPKTSSGNETWSTVWLIPDNICVQSNVQVGSGVCGYNKICRLNIDRRPDCQCPQQGFTLVDPEDEYRGCVPNFLQSCVEDHMVSVENKYDLDTVTNINWPTSDYELLEPVDEDSCRRSCLLDCMCSVAIFNTANQCWKKKLPLSNGRVDSSLNGMAFIKFKKINSAPQNPDSPTPNRKNEDTIILLISVFLGSSVFVNFILLGVISFGFLLLYRNKRGRTPKNESDLERNLHYFTYKELVDATNGFKEELGRGSFGTVYKGKVRVDSTSLIAVKKLDRVAEESVKEFKTEVNVIGQTHHKNLVRLIGFCDEGSHRLLVYEFLSNGSLAGFLFGDLRLSWNQRVEIAIAIAKGLLYLHDECNNPIIHCDIKPQNILLDDYYNARISDFGLAKLLRIDQSETQTDIRGTKGYVAPEWFRNMPVTVKTDVYSFGVLLLEIICCRRNVDMDVGEERAILTYWAYDCFTEGVIDTLVENDGDAISDRKKLQRFVMVAIWCIQEDPSLRPNMKKVVLMLEGIVEIGMVYENHWCIEKEKREVEQLIDA
ncbi:hypothetical protein LguiA_021752 [Lonicera macranthoides]